MYQKHLSPELIRVEKALTARADELDNRPQAIDEIPWRQVAAEFRELAKELHQS